MNHLLTYLIPFLLVAYVVYRRVQRTIGFQPLRPRLLIVRICILSVVGLVALGFGALHPIAYIGDGAGIVAGCLLGYAAVRFLSFERREGAWYYRTHIWVEAAVLVLFLGRLVFDIVVGIHQGRSRNSAAQFEDPLTAGVLLMFVCYYALFGAVLLHRERELRNAGGGPAAAG